MAYRYYVAQHRGRIMLRSSGRFHYTHVTVYPTTEAWCSRRKAAGHARNGVKPIAVVPVEEVTHSRWNALRDQRDGVDTLEGRLAKARRALITAQGFARDLGFIYQNHLLCCMGKPALERRRALSSYIRSPRDFDSWFERLDRDRGEWKGWSNANDVEELVRCGIAQRRAWDNVMARMYAVQALEGRIIRKKEV